MANKIIFALIGAGRIGSIHAAGLAENPLCELAAIVDIHQPAAQSLAKQYQAQVKTIDEVCSDNEIKAVLIASATDTHADYIERAARAGKAIFCEKPIDLSIERVRACLSVTKAHHTPLFIGFNRRFDSNFVAVRDAIANGRIGHLQQVIITSRDPAPPAIAYIKISGGLFRDMMIHDFDMAAWLLAAADDRPAQVFAYGGVFVDAEIGAAGDIDTAMVLIRSERGRQVHINNSRRATYGYDQRIEVFGEKGMAKADNEPATTMVLATEAGCLGDVVKPFFLARYALAYQSELNAFVTALAENRPLPVTGEAGYQALILADAALQSLQTNQPVDVKWQ